MQEMIQKMIEKKLIFNYRINKNEIIGDEIRHKNEPTVGHTSENLFHLFYSILNFCEKCGQIINQFIKLKPLLY